jgi:hypothetical protein
VGTKQGTLSQPGVGTELLYDSSKLKRFLFGQGLTGGTELQPDGSQTVTLAVKSNLPVTTLTPPASTPLSVAGGLQVSGLTQLQGLEASGVVAQQTVWVTGAAGAPAQSIIFPGSLQLGKWRIRGDELGAFILERFDDDGAIQTDGWQTIASFGHNVDTNVDRLTVDNLTVGGSDFGQALAAMEPAFVVEGPLEKYYNFSTGVTTLRLDTTGLGGNPFYCAGRVNANGTIASSIGQVGFTVTRPPGYPTGVYAITFNTPAPNNEYVVNLTQLGSGNIKIWDAVTFPPTTVKFHVVTYNTGWVLTDWAFHFSVVI